MDELEKQLLCPVCLEIFSKPVIILPCQHNLCRKCANDIAQESNPVWSQSQSRAGPGLSGGSGSRFRCPSCRHEVALDRHGVYGLQRNLLVENIIDIYRRHRRPLRAESAVAAASSRLVCEEHPDEKINIYCDSCQTPTCSLCKVFGPHRDCAVAPLATVYLRTKMDVSDGIARLVASNDHIQALISQMEDVCRTIEVNSGVQRERLSLSFSALIRLLDQKKQRLAEMIAERRDEKLRHVRALIRAHGGRLERGVALVESAICSMDEPHMSTFIQTATDILEKMAESSREADLQRVELGFENMSALTVDTEELMDMFQNIHFSHESVSDEEEEDEETESDP